MPEDKRKTFKKINQELSQITTNSYDKQQISKVLHVVQSHHRKHIESKKHIQRQPRYLIMPLRNLLINLSKKPIEIKYHTSDESLEVDKYNLNNDFVLCHCLIALHFAKIINVKKKQDNYLVKIALTKIGESYTRRDLKSVHNKIQSFANVIRYAYYFMQIITVLSYFIILILNRGSLALFGLLLGIELIGLIVEYIFNLLIKKGAYLYSKSTYQNFKNFLKDNRIEEPTYKFNYKKGLPLISQYIFN